MCEKDGQKLTAIKITGGVHRSYMTQWNCCVRECRLNAYYHHCIRLNACRRDRFSDPPSAGLMPTEARGNYLPEAPYLHETKTVRLRPAGI